MRIAHIIRLLGILAGSVAGPPHAGYAGEVVRTVVDADFPGAYQVEIADVNGDQKPDIIAVGGNTCAWYLNPGWKKRVVTTGGQSPGIISSATADTDGDGKAEIAIAFNFAMNTPKTGKLLMAVQGGGIDEPWRLVPLVDIGSIHRLRWGDLDGDGRRDLVIAPIFGVDAVPPDYSDPARLVYIAGTEDFKAGKVAATALAERPVMHSIEVRPEAAGGRSTIVTADGLGSVRVRLDSSRRLNVTGLIAGPTADHQKRGASEIHQGRLRDGQRFLATIGPWHGQYVIVYPEERDGPAREDAVFADAARRVIDDTLADGHALWVADVDRDGDDEIFAGHRGKDHRVSMYDYDPVKKAWNRSVIDRAVAAQDLRGGDLDGDGIPEVVTVGGSTHNVVLYRFP
jgi:hypothetical protein